MPPKRALWLHAGCSSTVLLGHTVCKCTVSIYAWKLLTHFKIFKGWTPPFQTPGSAPVLSHSGILFCCMHNFNGRQVAGLESFLVGGWPHKRQNTDEKLFPTAWELSWGGGTVRPACLELRKAIVSWSEIALWIVWKRRLLKFDHIPQWAIVHTALQWVSELPCDWLQVLLFYKQTKTKKKTKRKLAHCSVESCCEKLTFIVELLLPHASNSYLLCTLHCFWHSTKAMYVLLLLCKKSPQHNVHPPRNQTECKGWMHAKIWPCFLQQLGQSQLTKSKWVTGEKRQRVYHLETPFVLGCSKVASCGVGASPWCPVCHHFRIDWGTVRAAGSLKCLTLMCVSDQWDLPRWCTVPWWVRSGICINWFRHQTMRSMSPGPVTAQTSWMLYYFINFVLSLVDYSTPLWFSYPACLINYLNSLAWQKCFSYFFCLEVLIQILFYIALLCCCSFFFFFWSTKKVMFKSSFASHCPILYAKNLCEL